MTASRRLTFVYYCSGHGYGHAKRVSAFARHPLSLENAPTIHIVSSAPKHVFADSIAVGDPVIVQPLARAQKENKTWDESQCLKAIHADCVLSDAAFLGCLAAHHAEIPSILITNLSFDAVYRCLYTPLIDEPNKAEQLALNGMLSPHSANAQEELEPDVPIAFEVLAPLVEHIHSGYRCADLLLTLPGAIPLPSFATHPSLPSPDWVDIESRCFKSFVVDHLMQPPSSYQLLPQLPFPDACSPKPLRREIRAAPLLVRSPDPTVYTLEGRSRFLDSIGIPAHLHDPNTTKILIVSFGEQAFHKPSSRSHSRTPSKATTPSAASRSPTHAASKQTASPPMGSIDTERHAQAQTDALHPAAVPTSPRTASMATFQPNPPDRFDNAEPRWDASAPSSENTHMDEAADVRILPDDSWIAIVCGVPKDWGQEDGDALPDGFFVAPWEVY
ncbi:hypothetical protein C8Q76DRAFT_791310 [Earliella scabrosa]|nr:hypothetical protein C8Q76DRAFT_791310 [Earliella scabrosa]